MFECPGSVLASKDIPDHSSPAAERGTLIHKLAEEMLRIGFTDVSGLTHEEAQHLTDYNKFVKGLVDSGSVLYVEEKVSLQAYVSDMFGTIDALIVGEDAMHIIDLKTGSQKVYVEGNTQLMAYALGAASEYGFNKRIFIHIWQNGEHRMAKWMYMSSTISPKSSLRLQTSRSRRMPPGTHQRMHAAGARQRQRAQLFISSSSHWSAVTSLT